MWPSGKAPRSGRGDRQFESAHPDQEIETNEKIYLYYILHFSWHSVSVSHHAGMEIWYIGLLTSDFKKYSLGFSWEQWFLIHHIGTAVLAIFGFAFGLWLGFYFWKRIYERRDKE